MCPHARWAAIDRSGLVTRGRIQEEIKDGTARAAQAMQTDLEENFRAVLRGSLSRLDLVSRDEFDVQTKVLERTRAKLEALEARVKELEP
jgi:BMFP domain-containing protein YqiC